MPKGYARDARTTRLASAREGWYTSTVRPFDATGSGQDGASAATVPGVRSLRAKSSAADGLEAY